MKRVVIAIIIAFMLLPVINANAENTREIRVYLYREYPECVFYISWENAEQTAAIQIKKPDGTIIDADDQNTEFGKGRAIVSVGASQSGYWMVYVTGEGLGTIGVTGGNKYSAAAQYNAIQGFEAEAKDGLLYFKWDAIAERDTINVTITATQGEYGDRVTLWYDYSAQKSGTVSISPDQVQTGLYRFTLQVYDGKAHYTLSTDEALYIKNPSAPAKLEGLKAGSIDGEMFVTWDPMANGSYIVKLYDYETLSVIKTERVSGNYYAINLPDHVDKVKLSVAAFYDRYYGEFDVYEIIRVVPSGNIIFPDYASTRERSVLVTVDCPSDVTAGFYLDETLLLEDAASGDYAFNLSEGTHEIVAYLKDQNGSMKTFAKTITVDNTPPAINLNNADNIKTSTDSIVIDGFTEPNAVVAINGVEQKLESGSFMAKIALKKGVNPITITAYDLAGNKSVRTITVNRIDAFGESPLVYVVPVLLFLALTAWYIYLNRKPKEAQ